MRWNHFLKRMKTCNGHINQASLWCEEQEQPGPLLSRSEQAKWPWGGSGQSQRLCTGDQPWQALIRPWLDSLFSQAWQQMEANSHKQELALSFGSVPICQTLDKVMFMLENAQYSPVQCMTHEIHVICWRTVALKNLSVRSIRDPSCVAWHLTSLSKPIYNSGKGTSPNLLVFVVAVVLVGELLSFFLCVHLIVEKYIYI